MRILVIEDDDGVRDSLTDILLEEGHDVVASSTAQQALARLGEGEAPQVILLDLTMPSMNGERFREAQLANPAWAPIPVVILSARPDVARVAERLGARAYLRKPMAIEELLRVLTESKR